MPTASASETTACTATSLTTAPSRALAARNINRGIPCFAVALGKIGGREVDYGSTRMTLIAEIGKGAFDAVDGFANRHLGQADENGLGQAGSGVDLRLDGNTVDAHQGECVQLGEHPRSTQG